MRLFTSKIPVMAIAYDFDGTLAHGNMQEHQFLPDIGIKPADFWKEVGKVTRENQADKILVYMNLMLKYASAARIPVRMQDFKKRGKSIKLYEGVKEWFGRINAYGAERGIQIQHYLISSGNAEIFSGSAIANEFKQVFASKFLFDENGVAYWPALAVNYTTKTQYLFRINKNAFDLSDDFKVNEWVEKGDRPIPFENMIFIGDGETDIPCFRLVKDQGGLSIAVYRPSARGGRQKVMKYLEDGRVELVAPARYTENSILDRTVKASIDQLAAREALVCAIADSHRDI
jgi:phosphoserine phosphatase